MAQQLSTRLTAALASPLVPEEVGHVNAGIPLADFVEAAAGANNDTAVFKIEIPVGAIIHSVKTATDDLGTGTTMDVGLFKKDANGDFTAVSANCFAAAVDVATAATSLTERRFSALNIDTVNKKAWELAGLSARPSYAKFYLGVRFPAAVTAPGTVVAQVLASHS